MKDSPENKYVLKIFKDGSEEEANQEISVYEKLQNENIVKYFEYFKYDDGYGAIQTAIKLEYCSKGDLSKLCQGKKRKKVVEQTESEILETILQIITGLIYLHEKRFVHCDIKPGNIFLTEDKVKIADFGFAVPFKQRLMGGSLEYMPPEQFENTPGFVAHPSIDIWSFGCLVLELLTKKKHDLKISIKKNANYVEEVWNKEELNQKYSTSIRDLIVNCTKMDPIERPTSKQLYLSVLAINEQK
jgi:serine/threonine protein kinase